MSNVIYLKDNEVWAFERGLINYDFTLNGATADESKGVNDLLRQVKYRGRRNDIAADISARLEKRRLERASRLPIRPAPQRSRPWPRYPADENDYNE